jgi:branched-chain amino acid transport system substrate-binding protein
LTPALAACGAKSSGGSNSSGPLDIGYIGTLSGPQAEISKDSLEGTRTAVSMINKAGGINGRQIKLVVKDDLGDTSKSVAYLRSMASEGIKFVIGGSFDPNCLAMSPVAQALGVVEVSPTCSSDLLTTTKKNDSFFEVSSGDSEGAKGSAEIAAREYPGVKWQGLQPDFVFGHEVWTGFQKYLAPADPTATVGKNVFVPLDATQFGSYITSLVSAIGNTSAKDSGLFTGAFGGTMIGLGQQAPSYNFFQHYSGIVNNGAPYPTYHALGAKTPNMWFVYQYAPSAYTNASNTAFINAFKAMNGGADPQAWQEMGYVSVLALQAGIEKAKSTDGKTVSTAMKGMSFDTPQGNVSFGDGNLLGLPMTAINVVGDSASTSPDKVDIKSSVVLPASELE